MADDREGTAVSSSPEQTRAQAAAFVRLLENPGVILLSGELGAGKTEWVKGLVAALGGEAGQVASPTFALLHEYKLSSGVLHHWDLYRLEPGIDWAQLELWEHLAEAGAFTVVEWPERNPESWPENVWRVELEADGEEIRTIRWRRGAK